MAEKNNPNADILEIFSTIQGEGPFIGVKQIFIRFAKCNLKCVFCDEKSHFPPKEFSVEKLLSIVKQICENSGSHHSVSCTGGEPLLYRGFLKAFLPKLKESGLKVYLDTNGALPDALNEIIDFVDIVAMDFKLPSSTGNKAYWQEHKKSLDIARGKNCFIKAVITNQTTKEDIQKAVDIIYKLDKDLLLVLQPVWPIGDIKQPKNSLLFDYLFLAERKLKNVRIMPQVHKILGLR